MIDNAYIFSCSTDELQEALKSIKFPKAVNYRFVLGMPPKRAETTKGGIYLPEEAKETEHFRDSIGRILSIGETVGEVPALRQCKNFKVGDYISFNYYGSGSSRKIAGLEVRVIVDDIVDLDISEDPTVVDKLYD